MLLDVKLVCKGWNDLILGRDFVDLHLKNSIHCILVANKTSSRFNLFVLDKWRELAGTHSHRFPIYSEEISCSCCVLFSHAGLIVLKIKHYSSKVTIIVLNPVRPSHERVRITLCEELNTNMIFGVYYHPLLKEYCSLWMIHESRKPIQYMILILGSNPLLKRITYPFSDRVKMSGSKPLLICNCLYWMLRSEKVGYEFCWAHYFDIMKFDVISEEFVVIPSPLPLGDPECRHIELLNIDDVLSIIQIFPNKTKIWRSEDDDQGKKVWTNVEYTFKTEICDKYGSLINRIAVVNGKVAVFAFANREIVVKNLIRGTLKKYRNEGNIEEIPEFGV